MQTMSHNCKHGHIAGEKKYRYTRQEIAIFWQMLKFPTEEIMDTHSFNFAPK